MTDAVRRVGVIGDVHACDVRLAHLLDHLASRALDALWCVGDIVNGPGDPDRCAALLVSAGVVTVRGNHDRWCLEGGAAGIATATREFLLALPVQVETSAPDGTPVLLCHGLGGNDMNGIAAGDFGYALEVNDELTELRADQCRRVVVKGHRHQPGIWTVDSLTLIDAGTLLPDHAEICGVELDLDRMEVATLTVTPSGAVAEVERRSLRFQRDG